MPSPKKCSASEIPWCHHAPSWIARRIFLATLPSVFVLLIFGFGFAAGRYQVGRVLRRQIMDYARSETLGQIVAKDEKASYVLAYEDPAAGDG